MSRSKNNPKGEQCFISMCQFNLTYNLEITMKKADNAFISRDRNKCYIFTCTNGTRAFDLENSFTKAFMFDAIYDNLQLTVVM